MKAVTLNRYFFLLVLKSGLFVHVYKDKLGLEGAAMGLFRWALWRPWFEELKQQQIIHTNSQMTCFQTAAASWCIFAGNRWANTRPQHRYLKI